jgi:hypothetical protein
MNFTVKDASGNLHDAAKVIIAHQIFLKTMRKLHGDVDISNAISLVLAPDGLMSQVELAQTQHDFDAHYAKLAAFTAKHYSEAIYLLPGNERTIEQFRFLEEIGVFDKVKAELPAPVPPRVHAGPNLPPSPPAPAPGA